MEKFDYIEKSSPKKMTQKELQEYGQCGWELSVFNDTGEDSDERYYYVFKKKDTYRINS